MVHIPDRIPARNLVQIPGRIPANLNISRQIPQGVHTDSCRNLYKKNQIVKGIPARNPVSFSCGNTAVFLLDNFVQVVMSSDASIIFSENATKLVSIVPSTAEKEDFTFR